MTNDLSAIIFNAAHLFAAAVTAMTSNFVYTPPTHNNVPIEYHNSPYIGHFYTQKYSPFIPPMTLSGSAHQSPYGTPAAAAVPLPPSPYLGATSPLSPYPAYVPFPTSGDPSPYAPHWDRQRRSSWNGGHQPWIHNVPPTPTRQRTRSFNDPHADPSAFIPPAINPHVPHTFQRPVTAPSPILHPYLDGSQQRHDIVFDLSEPVFRPMRKIGHNTVHLTVDELEQNATHPPMYKIKITSDYLIPDFPINLDFRSNNPYDMNVPPIKLGDILCATYGALQKRISQYEWAKLGPEHEYHVAKAYTKRCKALGPAALAYQNQGVKNVDYLLGKTRFRGLVNVGESIEEMKLLVE